LRAGVGLVVVGQGRKGAEQFREAVWVKAGGGIGRESPSESNDVSSCHTPDREQREALIGAACVGVGV